MPRSRAAKSAINARDGGRGELRHPACRYRSARARTGAIRSGVRPVGDELRQRGADDRRSLEAVGPPSPAETWKFFELGPGRGSGCSRAKRSQEPRPRCAATFSRSKLRGNSSSVLPRRVLEKTENVPDRLVGRVRASISAPIRNSPRSVCDTYTCNLRRDDDHVRGTASPARLTKACRMCVVIGSPHAGRGSQTSVDHPANRADHDVPRRPCRASSRNAGSTRPFSCR